MESGAQRVGLLPTGIPTKLWVVGEPGTSTVTFYLESHWQPVTVSTVDIPQPWAYIAWQAAGGAFMRVNAEQLQLQPGAAAWLEQAAHPPSPAGRPAPWAPASFALELAADVHAAGCAQVQAMPRQGWMYSLWVRPTAPLAAHAARPFLPVATALLLPEPAMSAMVALELGLLYRQHTQPWALQVRWNGTVLATSSSVAHGQTWTHVRFGLDMRHEQAYLQVGADSYAAKLPASPGTVDATSLLLLGAGAAAVDATTWAAQNQAFVQLPKLSCTPRMWATRPANALSFSGQIDAVQLYPWSTALVTALQSPGQSLAEFAPIAAWDMDEGQGWHACPHSTAAFPAKHNFGPSARCLLLMPAVRHAELGTGKAAPPAWRRSSVPRQVTLNISSLGPTTLALQAMYSGSACPSATYKLIAKPGIALLPGRALAPGLCWPQSTSSGATSSLNAGEQFTLQSGMVLCISQMPEYPHAQQGQLELQLLAACGQTWSQPLPEDTVTLHLAATELPLAAAVDFDLRGKVRMSGVHFSDVDVADTPLQ